MIIYEIYYHISSPSHLYTENQRGLGRGFDADLMLEMYYWNPCQTPIFRLLSF